VGPIKVYKIHQAELDVMKLFQAESFPREVKLLSEEPPSRSNGFENSSLHKLSQMLLDGILRVVGRLTNAQVPFGTIHPIILPRKHTVTKLIIRNIHICEGHMGVSHILTTLRQRFWILHGAAAVKDVIRHCISCQRQNTIACSQLMAPLPAERVKAGGYSFSHTGLDYFGPFNVKQGRSVVKRYGCIFTCLQTRAVHIEVAHSMGTDSFIMVLTRSISRRGIPSDIYSDNGSNFIGAERELRSWIKSLDQSLISNKMLRQRIQWHFTPPYASHRGGIWERIIRSIRRVLSCVLREQNPSDETLMTTLVDVERILNNQPIVPLVTDDPENIALTPNSLLLLRSNTGLNSNCTILQRYRAQWKQAQYLTALFWRRWTHEYLPTLQARQRWISKRRSLLIGDVVLVIVDSMPRDSWPLGVIVGSYMDNDGLVRTVDIKMKCGVIKRDIRRVCLLEGVRVDSEAEPLFSDMRHDAGSPQVGGGSPGLPHPEGPPGTS
jgi:hypothetical protein